MKLMTLSILAVTLFSATGFSQERSERAGNHNRRVIISVNEDRSDINQIQRIRELERSVRDLQVRMYDLEDLVRGSRPVRPVGPECTLLGLGPVGSWNYNFRVAVDGNILGGHSTIETAIEAIKKYKEQNVCAATSYDTQCVLLGLGPVGSWNYNFRVGIKTVSTGETKILSGHSTDSDALSTMGKIRNAGICQ